MSLNGKETNTATGSDKEWPPKKNLYIRTPSLLTVLRNYPKTATRPFACLAMPTLSIRRLFFNQKYIVFLLFNPNHMMWVLVRSASQWRF